MYMSSNPTIRRRKLKEKAIAYKGGKCMLCQYDRCNAALEFHHKDRRTKAFGLSRNGIIRSWDSIREELDKCILVCANCHREIEAGISVIAAGEQESTLDKEWNWPTSWLSFQ